MAISVMNWVIAKTILERDRPDADPDDINRLSVVAALVPGVAGLLVPFVVQDSLPETPPPKEDTIDVQIETAKGQRKELEVKIKELEAKIKELEAKKGRQSNPEEQKDKGQPVAAAAK
jgi:hypothetical protein